MKWIALICLLSLRATAALEWEKTAGTLSVHPTQVHADVVYRFKNTGEKTISLSAVKVNCGCLAPKLAKRAFAPGESGELTVRLDLRGRLGDFKKSTIVTTSDGKKTTLTIATHIPKAYSVAPIMMKWTAENTRATKTAKLTNATKKPIKLLSVASSSPDFAVELKTIREGFEYEVVVTRPKPGTTARAVVRIKPEPPPGKTEAKELKFFAHAL